MDYASHFTKQQIDGQCKYIWGSILNALYMKERGDINIDSYLQTTINIISGCSPLFNNSPKIISVCSLLETARGNSAQFRKCIMDSMGLIDDIREEMGCKNV